VRDAVLGNVGTSVVFRLGAADALVLEGEFNPPFTALDLLNLPRFEAAVKLLARGQALAPFSARTLPAAAPPPDGHTRIDVIRAQSRARFARPRADVEASIAQAFGDAAAPAPELDAATRPP